MNTLKIAALSLIFVSSAQAEDREYCGYIKSIAENVMHMRQYETTSLSNIYAFASRQDYKAAVILRDITNDAWRVGIRDADSMKKDEIKKFANIKEIQCKAGFY